ncbi:hypothetical protein AAXE64_27945 [Priestia megaterium]
MKELSEEGKMEEKKKIATYYSLKAAHRMKRQLEDYDIDLEKESRLNQQLCKTCHYLKSSMAGQAFTKYNCQHCGEEHHHPNTNVPKYCPACSDKFDMCKKCGASKGD